MSADSTKSGGLCRVGRGFDKETSRNDFSTSIGPKAEPPPHPPQPSTEGQKRSKKGIGSAGKPPPIRAVGYGPQARATTAAGRPCGEAHHRAVHADAIVAEARRMRAAGLAYRAIGADLGVAYSTVWGWLNGKRPEPKRTAVYARWRRTAARSAAAAAKRSAS